MRLPRFLGGSRINYVYLIPAAILIAKLFEVILHAYSIEFASEPTDGGWFVSNFTEWFGAVYGILVTLVLVRVWEQFDDIDREFDREADTVKILYQDVLFLRGKNEIIGKEIIALLKNYVDHVRTCYPREVKIISDRKTEEDDTPPPPIGQQLLESIGNSLINLGHRIMKLREPEPAHFEPDNTEKLDDQNSDPVEAPQLEAIPENSETSERIQGDLILQNIRQKFKLLLQPRVMNEKVNEILVRELFQRLNELVDIRGDRIGMASQRLFDTLRFVVLVTSIIYVLPFYFVSKSPFPDGALDDMLIGGVTLLVVFIYLTIEDFDEPFYGTWRISDEPWQRLHEEIESGADKTNLEERTDYSALFSEPRRSPQHRSQGLKRTAPLRILARLAAKQMKQTQVMTEQRRTNGKKSVRKSPARSKPASLPKSQSKKQKK